MGGYERFAGAVLVLCRDVRVQSLTADTEETLLDTGARAESGSFPFSATKN